MNSWGFLFIIVATVSFLQTFQLNKLQFPRALQNKCFDMYAGPHWIPKCYTGLSSKVLHNSYDICYAMHKRGKTFSFFKLSNVLVSELTVVHYTFNAFI